MYHQSDLEDFYRCLACNVKLITYSFIGDDGAVPYVVCHNTACEYYDQEFPEGWGVRLLKNNTQLYPQAYPYPLGQDAAVSGQEFQAIEFVDPRMLVLEPASQQISEAVDSGAEHESEKLEKPLSELTNNSPEPILNIEAYVNRPIEQRQEEARAQGKPPRPLNAFILYRKAYQTLSKQFCSKESRTTVSQVIGDSWKLETEDVRSRFVEFANMERVNHQLAHPGYKLTQKPRN